MNPIAFTQQMKAMSDRLVHLYNGVNNDASLSPGLLSSALKELGVASERLELAVSMLDRQQQELKQAEAALTFEQQRQQELLEFIPDACLITNLDGTILSANRAATRLLNLPNSLLIDRSLPLFFTPETQKQLQPELQYLPQRPWRHEWQVSVQPYQKHALRGQVLVEASQSNVDQQPIIRWLLRDFSDRSANPDDKSSGSNDSYPMRWYHKGEIIPLELNSIWQVRSGLVKLTAFANNGQEILVGLAGQSASFGAHLTTLPLYQATALTNTQLCSISLEDIATSATLRQRLFDQMNQRLKQAELLLVIYGQPRIADRLFCLLELLKQEIGEPVPEGTRLKVRLTHEDLAASCCTTRVTVTRMLSHLQQEQKIVVDEQNHLILKDL